MSETPDLGPRARFARLLGVTPGPHVGWSYAARTTAAALACQLVSTWLGLATPMWAIVSAVVVILPELHASVRSAALRVVTNLIGAGAGLAIGALGLSPVPSLVLGLFAVTGLCRLFAVDAAARTASVALIIVLLRDPTESIVGSSELRVLSVALGCLVALGVTLGAVALGRLVTRLRRRAGTGS